jgi:hypothetical protein
MSSRPVPEDHRILPPPVPSQPSVIAPRAPSISQPTGIVGPTRPPALCLQDPQTPMPRTPTYPFYAATRFQLWRTRCGSSSPIARARPVSDSPSGLIDVTRSPLQHFGTATTSTHTPVRPRRDSLSPPVLPTVQQSRRESISLGPQPSVQPVVQDPMSAAVTQPSAPPSRRDSVILVFFTEWYCENGLPSEIVSDHDKLFMSRFWTALHKLTGVKLKFSTSYHPQTDGASERTKKTVIQCIRFNVERDQKGWSSCL